MKWSVVIDKQTKSGLYAVRKVFSGKKYQAEIAYRFYAMLYHPRCSLYEDCYAQKYPGTPLNEFRYKSIGENEWTYECE